MADANEDPPLQLPADEAANALVTGDTIDQKPELLTDVSTIQQTFHWIGFCEEVIRENIRNDSLGSIRMFNPLPLIGREEHPHSDGSTWEIED